MVALSRASIQRRLRDGLARGRVASACAACHFRPAGAAPDGWAGVDVGAHGGVDVDENALMLRKRACQNVQRHGRWGRQFGLLTGSLAL